MTQAKDIMIGFFLFTGQGD
jgi:hypothetical protein